uniref:Uncharacterized protein n=1 Tax=Tanacetum cinerariifolium TaxID=118510 RepID=A0A6L2MHT4_TANCI|nr:hypothetical protein [Tanacetum cinerariifolium]
MPNSEIFFFHKITLPITSSLIAPHFNEEGADQSEQIKELHQSVQEQIIQHNEKYKEHANKCRKQILYREGDLFWIHLRKERFTIGRFDLSSYKGDSDDETGSGSSLFQEGEDDADAVNEMELDVNMLLERCRTCHIAKTHSSNTGLYTPLSVPVALWDDFSWILFWVCLVLSKLKTRLWYLLIDFRRWLILYLI